LRPDHPTGLAADLDEVLDAAADDLARWRGARLLVTGATGFVGTWLLETLAWADTRLGLGVRAVAASRDPARLPPHLAGHPAVLPLPADVRALPPVGAVDAVVHAAAPSSAPFGRGDGAPHELAATILDGTRAVLEAAGPVPLLFVSSGAVYGRAPGARAFPEDAPSGPDPLDVGATYGEAKRMAETLCAVAVWRGRVRATVARCFTFIGPHLPLGAHFAAGNFLADALAGRPVTVGGDGRAERSYLYAGDLAAWLWALLARGAPGRAYNVGSERAVTIAELAAACAAQAAPPVPVVIAGRPAGGAVDRYLPDTARARSELGVEQRVGLDEAIARTLAWHRRRVGVAA
jgi:nucleoside-diphosphate-sugar epimerase